MAKGYHERREGLREAEKYIKRAWIIGVVWGCITLLMVLLVGAVEENRYGITYYNVIDALVILLLSFGIYKKNRFSSVMILVYIVFNLISGIPAGRFSLARTLIPIVMCYFFGLGAIGIFEYHKLTKPRGKK